MPDALAAELANYVYDSLALRLSLALRKYSMVGDTIEL